MTHRAKHLRKLGAHALRHNNHHKKLKQALTHHSLERERNYWAIALVVILLTAIGWFASYRMNLKNTFGPKELRPAAPNLYTSGYEQGLEISHALGLGETDLLNQNESFSPENLEGLANSLVTATNLSKTSGAEAIVTQLLQKSLLTGFYLGETTNAVGTALVNDTELLNEIENVLSVELSQYLNQSANRADALNNYLNLMAILEEKAGVRQNELISTINFLERNIQAQEQMLSTREELFFNQMGQAIQPQEGSSFVQPGGSEGAILQEDLDEFIGLQQEQAEAMAKKGAYESLNGYYAYYQPILQQRIQAIAANRDALIAGVVVVDLPGIEGLGLIERN